MENSGFSEMKEDDGDIIVPFQCINEKIKQLYENKHLPCNICGKEFSNHYNLSTHKRDVHKSKKCLSCDKMFKIRSYYRHLSSCKKTFSCGICDYDTKSKKIFKKHVRSEHPMKKKYTQCNSCSQYQHKYVQEKIKSKLYIE